MQAKSAARSGPVVAAGGPAAPPAPVLAPALALGAAALLVLAGWAFWPTYLGRPFGAADRYTHAHALIGTLWMLLLVAQAGLITRQRRGWHRRVGRGALLLAPLFVLSGVLLAHARFSRMDAASFEREAHTLYLPISAVLLFGAACTLAFVHRRAVRLHARFMACTALVLVDPVLGRFLAFHVVEWPQFWHYQMATFAVELALLLAMGLSLPAQTRERRVFAAFGAAYAAVLLLWFAVPRWAPWLPWAAWFRSLPLT